MFPLWSTSASYILQQTSRQRPHPLISKHQNHLYRFVLSPCTPHNYGMIYDSDCTNAFTTQLLISSPRLMVLSTSLISISMVPFSSFFLIARPPCSPISLYIRILSGSLYSFALVDINACYPPLAICWVDRQFRWAGNRSMQTGSLGRCSREFFMRTTCPSRARAQRNDDEEFWIRCCCTRRKSSFLRSVFSFPVSQ